MVVFSFICSSNNNIQRITGMVQSAARHFSPALLSYTPPLEPTTSSLPSSATVSSPPPDLPSLSHGPTTYHPFPPPSAFASPSVIPILRSLGFGYRAPFIQRTAEMLTTEHPDTPEPGTAEEDGEAGGEAGSAAERFLLGMREWETEKAREELLRYLGVGRKVADCVLLMSLDKVRLPSFFPFPPNSSGSLICPDFPFFLFFPGRENFRRSDSWLEP
jgi:N-glycosylase/DNA lyase